MCRCARVRVHVHVYAFVYMCAFVSDLDAEIQQQDDTRDTLLQAIESCWGMRV